MVDEPDDTTAEKPDPSLLVEVALSLPGGYSVTVKAPESMTAVAATALATLERAVGTVNGHPERTGQLL